MISERIDFSIYENSLMEGFLFSFSVKDAWMRNIHSIDITEENKIFVYSKNKGYFQVCVSAEIVEEVKKVLLENLCILEDNFVAEQIQHCIILDGLVQTFIFSVEGLSRAILGFNLDCFQKSLEGYPDETMESTYPNVSILLRILKSVENICSDIIDKEYFSLEG